MLNYHSFLQDHFPDVWRIILTDYRDVRKALVLAAQEEGKLSDPDVLFILKQAPEDLLEAPSLCYVIPRMVRHAVKGFEGEGMWDCLFEYIHRDSLKHVKEAIYQATLENSQITEAEKDRIYEYYNKRKLDKSMSLLQARNSWYMSEYKRIAEETGSEPEHILALVLDQAGDYPSFFHMDQVERYLAGEPWIGRGCLICAMFATLKEIAGDRIEAIEREREDGQRGDWIKTDEFTARNPEGLGNVFRKIIIDAIQGEETEGRIKLDFTRGSRNGSRGINDIFKEIHKRNKKKPDAEA